jgi:hypothetical protein
MIAGGDCIDDVQLLRAGSTASVLGHRVMAASSVGTFLRAFTLGHVQQLDKVTGELLTRAWAAGAGSGEVLHARLRKGAANTARGILRLVDELVARLRRAGASGAR